MRNKIRKGTEVVVQLSDGSMHRTSENHDSERWSKRLLPIYNTLIEELKLNGVDPLGPAVVSPQRPNQAPAPHSQALDQHIVTITVLGAPPTGPSIGLVSSEVR
ncbi:MAG: hypothetical protein QM749_03440 [Aquabacterium sp.]